jgi:hypothetical protein
MPNADQKIRTYRELADIYDRQGQAQMRDRFLVLAADTALAAGQAGEAERLRVRLLQFNPHHLLKPYDSFAEAAKSTDVENYLSALRRSHPYERSEHLLESLRQGGEDRGPAATRNPAAGRNDRPSSGPRGGPDLQVYRVVDANEAPGPETSRPRSVSPEPSSPRDRSGKPAAPSSPVRHPEPSTPRTDAPSVYPLRSDPRSSSDNAGFELLEDGRVGGAWVATGWAILVLVAGLLLAVYTFARPFLPRNWLP